MTRIQAWVTPIDRVFLNSFASRIGLLGLGFATSVALARFFGASAVGQMSLVVALLVVTAHLSLFGTQMTILKRVPSSDASERNEALGPAVVVTLVLGLVVGLSLSALLQLGALGSYAELGAGFALVLPLVVLANAFRVLALETLRGLRQIRTYNAVNLLIAAAILFAIVTIYLGGGQTIDMPMVIFATEVFAMVLVGTLILRCAGRSEIGFRFNRAALGSHLRISAIYFLSGSSVLIGQLDVLIAGIYLPVEDVGAYAIGLKLAALVGLVLASANISFAPYVAGIYKNDGLDAAVKSARRQTQMLVPLTTAMGLGVAVVGYSILGFFGPAFQAVYPVLLILIAAQMAGVLFGPVGIFLNMTIGQREMVVVTIFALATGLIAGILLIPKFEVTGAAITNLVTLLVRNVTATAFLYLRTGKGITILHAWRAN